MIFEKQSLRTRSTFDIAMYQLGGHSVLLSQNYIGWGVRETIKDVAHNLERWVEGIMARTYGHETLLELAQHADVPIINGLSDLLHPCQLAADYLTLIEEFGELEGLKIVFIGDGNNVANSHINAAALTGTALTIVCPEGFDPDERVLETARNKGADITLARDPRGAVQVAERGQRHEIRPPLVQTGFVCQPAHAVPSVGCRLRTSLCPEVGLLGRV